MKIIIPLFILMFSLSVAQIKAEKSLSNYDSQPKYIGCWIGMNGGKLKLTTNKIYDLDSKENSSYKEKPTTKKELKGLQTGEAYLLEATNDFPKGFLAKWVSFSFNNDGTVGITSFDSYSDYLKDKFVGMGLFQKIPCKNLK
jgi:hypothetical protein